MRAGQSIAAAVLLVLTPAAADARFLFFGGKKKVERIIVVPAPTPVKLTPLPRPLPPPAGRANCVDVRRVKAAQVFGDHAVEVTLAGGKRWMLYFAQQCPTLSFYDGFYYRVAEQGRLCAGRDAVIARSGGECAIASIMALKPPTKSRTKPRRRRG